MSIEARYVGARSRRQLAHQQLQRAEHHRERLPRRVQARDGRTCRPITPPAGTRPASFAYFGAGTGTSPLPIFLALLQRRERERRRQRRGLHLRELPQPHLRRLRWRASIPIRTRRSTRSTTTPTARDRARRRRAAVELPPRQPRPDSAAPTSSRTRRTRCTTRWCSSSGAARRTGLPFSEQLRVRPRRRSRSFLSLRIDSPMIRNGGDGRRRHARVQAERWSTRCRSAGASGSAATSTALLDRHHRRLAARRSMPACRAAGWSISATSGSSAWTRTSCEGVQAAHRRAAAASSCCRRTSSTRAFKAFSVSATSATGYSSSGRRAAATSLRPTASTASRRIRGEGKCGVPVARRPGPLFKQFDIGIVKRIGIVGPCQCRVPARRAERVQQRELLAAKRHHGVEHRDERQLESRGGVDTDGLRNDGVERRQYVTHTAARRARSLVVQFAGAGQVDPAASASSSHSPDSCRIELMLDLEDPRREGLGGIVLQHRHRLLKHDRAGIEVLVHKMNSGAALGGAVVQGLLLRVQAGIFRQQRRVNVEDAIRKRVDEHRAQQAHEPGEADERDAALFSSATSARS